MTALNGFICVWRERYSDFDIIEKVQMVLARVDSVQKDAVVFATEDGGNIWDAQGGMAGYFPTTLNSLTASAVFGRPV